MLRLVLVLCLFSANAFAGWQLNADVSSLHFMSTKNNHITEVHTFDSLQGTLTQGKAEITIPLSSVNTLIPIRNERMQAMLFKVADFPVASFSADIDNALMELKRGESKTTDVAGILNLHGQEVSATFSVRVTRTSADEMVVATTKPYILNVADFDLTAGIDALRTIAGLNVIGYAVPITFNVVFNTP